MHSNSSRLHNLLLADDGIDGALGSIPDEQILGEGVEIERVWRAGRVLLVLALTACLQAILTPDGKFNGFPDSGIQYQATFIGLLH